MSDKKEMKLSLRWLIGCLIDETIDTLKSRVFKVSLHEKYKELESEETNPPICLFSKVDACKKINELMLESLETEKIELSCVDVVDESGSTAKFDKKQEKELEKQKIKQAKQLVNLMSKMMIVVIV
uniref:Uncharacterized protein n=1 Tax=Amphimedon queenslandica TaxID=400682 RepID=A0A1X7URJ8_AMPQE